MPRAPSLPISPCPGGFPRATPWLRWLIGWTCLSLILPFPGEAQALLATHSEGNSAAVKPGQALIEKSLRAYGGAAKILSLNSFAFEYRVQSDSRPDSQPLSAKVYFKDTDQFRSEVRDGDLQVVTVISGNQGWVEVAGTTLPRPAKELSPLRNETLSLLRPDLLLLIFSKYRYSGRIKEDGRSLDQVQVSGFVDGEYIRGRLSISVESSLIEKYEFEIERATKGGTGIFRGQSLFLRYGEAKGFKFPEKILSRKTGITSQINVTAATLGEPLDEDLFREAVTPSTEASGR